MSGPTKEPMRGSADSNYCRGCGEFECKCSPDRSGEGLTALVEKLKPLVTASPYGGMYHCVHCGASAIMRHDDDCPWFVAQEAMDDLAALAAVPDPHEPVTVALLKALKEIWKETTHTQDCQVLNRKVREIADAAIALAESAPVSPGPDQGWRDTVEAAKPLIAYAMEMAHKAGHNAKADECDTWVGMADALPAPPLPPDEASKGPTA